MIAIVFIAAILTPSTIDSTAEGVSVDTAWSILQGGVLSSSSDRRAKAVTALQLLPRNGKAQVWAEHALKDSSSDVRQEAATVLGPMGDQGARPKLRDALKDKEIKVVLAAAGALYTLHDPAAYDVYYALLTGQRKSSESLIQSQLDILKDRKQLEQFALETGIGFVPYGGMGWQAWKTISHDDATPIRAQAAEKLIHDPDPKSGEALAKSCADKKWQVRAAVVNAIARRGDPTLVRAVVPLMNDDNDTVRYNAAAAVVYLSSQTTIRNDSARNRRSAVTHKVR